MCVVNRFVSAGATEIALCAFSSAVWWVLSATRRRDQCLAEHANGERTVTYCGRSGRRLRGSQRREGSHRRVSGGVCAQVARCPTRADHCAMDVGTRLKRVAARVGNIQNSAWHGLLSVVSSGHSGRAQLRFGGGRYVIVSSCLCLHNPHEKRVSFDGGGARATRQGLRGSAPLTTYSNDWHGNAPMVDRLVRPEGGSRCYTGSPQLTVQ